MEGDSASDPDDSVEANDYDLAIDSQVEKFVEIKQKLTYFLITASVAVIAFLVTFAVDHPTVGGFQTASGVRLFLLITSSLAGFATAGLSLMNLHLEHKSYAKHLKYRYQRKRWDALPDAEKRRWEPEPLAEGADGRPSTEHARCRR